MSFEMSMLVMYHVYYLTTEIEGKQPTKVPKSTPTKANQTSLINL